MKSLLLVAALGGVALAEPCPQMGLVLETVKPKVDVTADGGVVVVETSRVVERVKGPDWTGWTVKTTKSEKPELSNLAPGLYVVKPPAGAKTFELWASGAKKTSATVIAAPPLLAAPSLKLVTSGTSKSRHPSRFVKVDLAGVPPKGAIALVLADAKGKPLSWGLTDEETDYVLAYSTQGGCVSEFPNGTVIAQPGDKVTAFWVDGTGRVSPASTAAVVKKP
jgi:hypothetical protein